jgi:hypothetical protein
LAVLCVFAASRENVLFSNLVFTPSRRVRKEKPQSRALPRNSGSQVIPWRSEAIAKQGISPTVGEGSVSPLLKPSQSVGVVPRITAGEFSARPEIRWGKTCASCKLTRHEWQRQRLKVSVVGELSFAVLGQAAVRCYVASYRAGGLNR